MTIKDETLRQVGTTLKRQAKTQSMKVDDAFIIELGNYARHKVVEHLDENDTRIVLEKIGEETLKEHGVLDSASVWSTIHKICRPKDGYDLCSGAARNILHDLGRKEAVRKLDKIKTKLLAEWTLDE
jgi:hypothetical protein